NHWWRLCGILWQSQGYERPDWASWPEVPSEVLAVRESTLSAAPLAVRASLADGFDSLGSSALGDRWEPELTALNQPAPVFLRVNTLRTKLPAVQKELREHGLETAPVPGAPAALRVLDGKAVPARLREGG